MLWYYLRAVFSITIPTFYKGYQGRNLERLRVKGPVLISMNHPNAFMDPIAFSTLLHHPRTYYLARGDAFKKGFISYFLETIGIVPIFRIQDAGIEGVKKNNESFKIVFKLLKNGEKIMVFSEGLCIQERRLRPIQKGTARMAFGYMDETGNEDLQIIPVSVNYSKPEEFRSRLFYDVGEPILVKEYYSMYKENNAKGVNELTREIEKRMRAIVPHLDDKANDSLINQLYRIYMERWMEQQGLDKNSSEHQQNYWFHAIHLINRLSVEHPQQVLELREKTTQYTSRLHQLNISDSGLSNFKSASGIGIKVLAFSAVAPFYYTGKILHVLPLFIAGKIADKTCKDIEFHSSVNVVTWSLLIQVFFLLELLMVGLICQSFLALLIYTIIKIGTGYFALRLSDWKKHLREMLRIRKLNKQNPDIVGELQSQRASILELLK